MHRSDLSPCALRWALRGLTGLALLTAAYAALYGLGFNMQTLSYGLGVIATSAVIHLGTRLERIWGERDEEDQ